MIRIDAVWLATEPIDMRAGTDSALARVVRVFGPDGHFKFPHLWPVKLLQAGRGNYQSFDGSRAMRALASLSR